MEALTILAAVLFTIALIGFIFGLIALILPTLKKVVFFIIEFLAFFALIIILPIVKFIKVVFRLKSI